jgi:hypothetical protein
MSTHAKISVLILNAFKQRSGVFFAAVLLLCSSCAQPPPPAHPEQPATLPQSVAERFFLNNDFANALLEYERDYETALAPDNKASALYGLACTQLILARSDNQITEAIGNLEKWDTEKGNTPVTENRHLLVAAMKVQVERMQKKNLEHSHLTKQKNSVIANQRKKILQMGTTVDNLQKQLEELEAIDETLQEKKKPL